MLLQPRNFIFKKKQKNRRFLSFNSLHNNLSFGGSGLLLLRAIQLTAKQLSRFKLFLKRAMKKADRTRRFVWFHAFPHLPLTAKSKGTRMGKGKGKLECWFTSIPGGVVLIEFRNLRKGRANFFMIQMTRKLGVPTKNIFSTDTYLNFPIKTTKKIFFKTFW